MKLKFNKQQLSNYVTFLSKTLNCSNEAIIKFDLSNQNVSTSVHDEGKTWIRMLTMSDDLFEVVDNENIDKFSICLYGIKNYIDTIKILQSFENSESITIDFKGYEDFKEINVNEVQTKQDDNLSDLVTRISDKEILYTDSTKIVFNHADTNLISQISPYVKTDVEYKYKGMVEKDKLIYSLKIDNISNICNLLKKQMQNCIDSAFISIILDETKNKLIFKTSDSVIEYSIPIDEIVEINNSDGNSVYRFSFKPVKNILSAVDTAKSISLKFNENNFVNFEENIGSLNVNDFVASIKK